MAETDTDDDEFEYHKQTTVHPTTVVEGQPTRLLAGSGLLDHSNSNVGVGIVFENPTVQHGSVWRTTELPDDYDTVSEYNDDVRRGLADDGDYVRGEELDDDAIQNARERVENARGESVDWANESYDALSGPPSDYKVVNENDRDAEVKTVDLQGETHTTGVGVGSGEFRSEQVDDFEGDEVIAWFGGMAANVMLRALDVNGGNFARFDDGFVPGLFQPPTGWRTGSRDEAKEDGRYPKAVRPPVLRTDLSGESSDSVDNSSDDGSDRIGGERIFLCLSRFNGGNGFEANLGRALDGDEYDDFVDALQSRDSSYDDIDYEYDEIGLSFDDDAMSVLQSTFDDVNAVHDWVDAEGYVDTPANFDGDFVAAAGYGDDTSSDDGGSFDVAVDDDGDDGGVTDEERQFGEMVATKLAGTDADPDEEGTFADGNDLAGLVAANSENFDGEPSVSNIREVVYEELDHLDASSL